MATVSYSIAKKSKGYRLVVWSGLQNGDVGAPLEGGPFSDKSVHVFGTFGTGGTVVLQGSNSASASDWVTLHDPQGANLSFTTSGAKAVLENTVWVRPAVTGGDVSTSLTVALLIVSRVAIV